MCLEKIWVLTRGPGVKKAAVVSINLCSEGSKYISTVGNSQLKLICMFSQSH